MCDDKLINTANLEPWALGYQRVISYYTIQRRMHTQNKCNTHMTIPSTSCIKSIQGRSMTNLIRIDTGSSAAAI